MKHLFRSNAKLLPYLQVLLTVATLLTLALDFSWQWAFVSLFAYFMIGCFGISIGFHRYITHKSFDLKYDWMKYPMMWLGCLAGTGGPLVWAAVHREHHKHADQPGDPHSPHNLGVSTFIADYRYEWNPWPVRDLIADPKQRFLNDYYFLLIFIWLAAAALITPKLALYGVVVPMTIMIWLSTASSYLTHKFGYRNYDTRDDSRNLWYMAVLTFGEGWHNNHHRRQGDYWFKRKWWELDLGGSIIHHFLKRGSDRAGINMPITFEDQKCT